MKKLELNQMENFIAGGAEDWCNAIDGLGGYDFINGIEDRTLRLHVGGLYNAYCAY